MNKLNERLNLALSELGKHCSKFPLLQSYVQNKEPDEIILSAIGSHLHSYYNGIEKIFDIINKETDKFSFNDGKSHSELLSVMAMKTNNRNAVITEQSKNELADYMKFRHFFRHSYSYDIDWNKVKPLLNNIQKNWQRVHNEIETFRIDFVKKQTISNFKKEFSDKTGEKSDRELVQKLKTLFKDYDELEKDIVEKFLHSQGAASEKELPEVLRKISSNTKNHTHKKQ
ncbi:hypothetical protein [Treponema sp.]|uniref:ribonuclease toxin HepT-like protein n=1 Tax=Treponema sp. TaxID=166 RepID=UPI003F11E0B1